MSRAKHSPPRAWPDNANRFDTYVCDLISLGPARFIAGVGRLFELIRNWLYAAPPTQGPKQYFSRVGNSPPPINTALAILSPQSQRRPLLRCAGAFLIRLWRIAPRMGGKGRCAESGNRVYILGISPDSAVSRAKFRPWRNAGRADRDTARPPPRTGYTFADRPGRAGRKLCELRALVALYFRIR